MIYLYNCIYFIFLGRLQENITIETVGCLIVGGPPVVIDISLNHGWNY